MLLPLPSTIAAYCRKRLALLLLLLVVTQQTPTQAQPATLQETLAAAQAALAGGDYEMAFTHFSTIETTFGAEPEVAEDSFQIVVAPLHAYAALLTGDTATAIARFEGFLERFPDDRSRQAFVLFNLARAYAQSGEARKAIESYRRFVALEPDRPEAALATLSAAELMFETGSVEEGLETLDSLMARQTEGVIRNKARLSALQQALHLNRTALARDYLLAEPWSVTEMPELAVLAFSALEMGQALLAETEYAQAIACYRLVPPYRQLIAAQRERLEATRTAFESRVQSVGLYQGGQFWTQFYRNLISRLEQQLAALEAAEDYSPALYLSYGQAYLLAGRPHEAWILFETLTRDPQLSEEKQAEAHYRWILAAIEIGVWEDAFRIAEGFGERFPESPLVPDALYLLATAHQDARQYRDAIEVLDSFLRDHPTHELAPRVLFVRGYNYNLLNEPVLAREDFESFIDRYPQHGLYQDARFWRALTYFAENDYEATLEALRELQGDVEGHRLEPEIAYRIAATLYAKKDYEAALKRIRSYLEAYSYHSRHEEGRVLLGDIQMGRGELSEARAIFASIRPSAGPLFAYAVFQTGKILRAVTGAEDRAETRTDVLASHLEHFEHYIAREDIPLRRKSRLSEALYWIGWTHIEQEAPELARQVFTEALDQYGDAIEAEEVPNIIDALARTEKRLSGLGRAERETALKEWIAAEKKAAQENDRLTYFARLNFYLQSMFPPDEPESLIFETVETVPIERLDPEGLGRIAATLAERYPNVAKDYLIRLEDEYPDSRHRSYGYYARAILDMQDGDYASAREELARLRAESPMHPLALPASLRYAESLTQTERYEKARETLEEILRLRQAKGRPHAQALLALSRNAEAAGQLKRAIPYAQRVYNVYRAYPELTAQAYWMSALQFEAIGDPVAAYKTLDEMLKDPRIEILPIAEQATDKRAALLESLPEGALDAAEEPSETAQVESTGEEQSP